MPSEILNRKIFHDLFGSLSNLNGTLSLLREESDLSLEDREESLDLMSLSAKRLQSQLEDLADLLALEGGYLGLKIENFNFVELAEKTIQELKQSPRWQAVQLKTKFKGRSPQIQSDPGRLSRLFSHLLEFFRQANPQLKELILELMDNSNNDGLQAHAAIPARDFLLKDILKQTPLPLSQLSSQQQKSLSDLYLGGRLAEFMKGSFELTNHSDEVKLTLRIPNQTT